MSSGPFTETYYRDDLARVWLLRVQPETTLVWGASVPGPAEIDVHAIVSRSRRSFGCHARRVRCIWNAPPPAGYKSTGYIVLPIPDPADFPNFYVGAVFPYLGSTLLVVGRQPEYRK